MNERTAYNSNYDNLNVFLFGGLSSSISKTFAAPVERIKFFLQNQQCLNINPQFKGAFDCYKSLTLKEGFFSLWRGNFLNVVRSFPTQGLIFVFNEYFNKLFFEWSKIKYKYRLKIFLESCISGGLAGAATLLFVYPLDLVRTRLALDYNDKSRNSNRKFNGANDCFQQIYKKDGIVGLYRGIGVSIFGIMQYRALFFGGIDLLKGFLFNKNISMTLFFLLKFL